MTENYYKIINHYERCLEQFGDTHKGVDWPKLEDVDKRYNVMLDVIKFSNREHALPVSLLDFGCGTGHLLEYIKKSKLDFIHYSGLDISQRFIDVASLKYPDNKFYCLDILRSDIQLKQFDFIVMNGVFTEKRDLLFDEMWEYFQRMIKKVFQLSTSGLAFNVMSKAVDWEREDLFHLSADLLIEFLAKEVSRNFIIRNDYGLYEYTVYIYK
jgi:SAM-dependent methyltransferase